MTGAIQNRLCETEASDSARTRLKDESEAFAQAEALRAAA